MKRTILFGVFLLALLYSSCEDPFIMPDSEYAYESYDGELVWEQQLSTADWSPRYDQAAVVFDDALWVFGGYDPTMRGDRDSYMEDIWKSEDGITWALVSDNAPWKGRRGHSVSVFDGYIYLSGGFAVDGLTGERGYKNDLWRSLDGIVWDEVSTDAPWEMRMNHGMLASDDALYLFGGFTHGRTYFSDMWKFDGTNWTQLATDIPGARASFASCIGDDGRFYLQGGSFYGSSESRYGRVDESVENWSYLWAFDPADEAAGWTLCANPTGGSVTRAEHILIPYDGKIWMLAGRSNSGYRFSHSTKTYATEVYDPETDSWSTESLGSGFGPRYSYSALSFDYEDSGEETIMILGGFNDSGARHDIWYVKGGM